MFFFTVSDFSYSAIERKRNGYKCDWTCQKGMESQKARETLKRKVVPGLEPGLLEVNCYKSESKVMTTTLYNREVPEGAGNI